MKTEDRELVRRVLCGQTDEFRVLVERYQPSVFRFTSGLLWDPEDARDVTQDVFLAAFASLSNYMSSRAAFSTWLFTIARNRCINLLRRNRPMLLEHPTLVTDAQLPDPLARREFGEQLDLALAALPIELRSAFVLAEIEELPYAEIARIEQTSIGTVKSRIHRAKRRLRSLLQPMMKD